MQQHHDHTVLVAVLVAAGPVGGLIYAIVSHEPMWEINVWLTALGILILAFLLKWVLCKGINLYCMGYRHGRNDARRSLMETGIWISHDDLDDVDADPDL